MIHNRKNLSDIVNNTFWIQMACSAKQNTKGTSINGNRYFKYLKHNFMLLYRFEKKIGYKIVQLIIIINNNSR